MSSDNKGSSSEETIGGEVKALAVEAYKDGAAPTVKAVGGTLGRVVRLALRPLELLVEGGERLMSRVEQKLHGVPENRLIAPPATIAVPAALQYALLGDGPDEAQLREMFENLLTASMDSATAANAHPAFVTMISQLTPDEAWIVKSIDRDYYEYFDVWPLREIRTMLGTGTGINERRISIYISNLARIGIIALHTGTAGEAKNASAELTAKIDSEFPNEVQHSQWRQLLLHMNITPLGRQFLDTCVRSPESIATR